MTLAPLDHFVILAYAVLVAGMSVRLSRKQRTTQDYFMASRSVPGWAVAMALMATLIGSGTIVGHPATVYQSGLILLLGSLTLPLVLWFVARVIVPFYRHSVGMSAYEYIGTRFGLGARLYSSAGFVLDRLFDLGVTLVTTAIAINVMTGWPLHEVIAWCGLFTVAYTMVGGMSAVVWTSVVQGVILAGGAVIILFRLIFNPAAGAPGAVVTRAWQDGRLDLGNFDFSWASLTSPDLTVQWLFLLAYAVNWGRRYIADQHMVQRYLIARSDAEACRGALWNAWLCVPIYVVFMFIGACLYGHYQLSGEPPPPLADQVVPYFIMHHMPAGIVGLLLAAILAASMSSISADLNSIATVLTTDYLAHFRPATADRTRLRFGRLMVLLGGGVAVAVALLLVPKAGLRSVMERGVTIAAILSGGTLGLFFLGFLTRRATRRGCYWGIGACVIFTAWGLLTEPHHRVLDLGFNFNLNPILIGVFGHAILFGVGYLASLVLGGWKPPEVDALTFRRRPPAPTPAPESVLR